MSDGQKTAWDILVDLMLHDTAGQGYFYQIRQFIRSDPAQWHWMKDFLLRAIDRRLNPPHEISFQDDPALTNLRQKISDEL